MKNIALCFCVRDCEPYLSSVFQNIDRMRQQLTEYKIYCIFVYDNCIDNSEEILKQYQANYPDDIIVHNIPNTSALRTVRIAKARNVCLYFVYKILTDISYHFMIDCDDVCQNNWNIDIISKYLQNSENDDWDSISFNRPIYYDIWALLFDDFKHHCWGFGSESNQIINLIQMIITNKIKDSKTDTIEVLSAFNGFAIYKTERFRDIYYDGTCKSNIELITYQERNKTINILKKKYGINAQIDETGMSCEHIFYHLLASKKNECKIKISKHEVV